MGEVEESVVFMWNMESIECVVCVCPRTSIALCLSRVHAHTMHMSWDVWGTSDLMGKRFFKRSSEQIQTQKENCRWLSILMCRHLPLLMKYKKERTEDGEKHALISKATRVNIETFFSAFASMHVSMCRTCTTCISLKTDSLISIFMTESNSNKNRAKDLTFKSKMVEWQQETSKHESVVCCALRVLESKVPTYQNQMLLIPLN